MRSALIKMVPALMITLVAAGCVKKEKPINREAEIAEISKVIDSGIGWFKNKDFNTLFSVVTHDSDYISVHPGNRVIRGFRQFEKNAEIFKRPEFRYVRHEIKDLIVTLSNSGDVAWWYCVLDDINSWDGQPANWENTRWTGVLEKRNDHWVIVQQHFSFAAE